MVGVEGIPREDGRGSRGRDGLVGVMAIAVGVGLIADFVLSPMDDVLVFDPVSSWDGDVAGIGGVARVTMMAGGMGLIADCTLLSMDDALAFDLVSSPEGRAAGAGGLAVFLWTGFPGSLTPRSERRGWAGSGGASRLGFTLQFSVSSFFARPTG